MTVEGSQAGRRTGYVEAHLIEVLAKPDEAPPRITAASAIPPKSAGAATSQAAPVPGSQGTQAPTLPAPGGQREASAARATRTAVASEAFQKSKLNLTVGDKTQESDVIVRYESTALVIVDKKSGEAAKTFPYAAMKGAEYSYAKNPRWKTAIFVSPLFLFTSGKKHWFLVQGEGDYALLHLDKSNYRLILAAFEARTGLKVEAVTDTK